jgi:hypothetical protein
VRLRSAIALAAALFAGTMPGQANEWRVEPISAPGPVKSIDNTEDGGRFAIGGGLFRAIMRTYGVGLVATAGTVSRPRPDGALPDSRIAEGKRNIARAWLADPTGRYRHAVLGDAIEAGSLVVERRDRTQFTLRLPDNAVFEDLEPRIADLGGSERVVVVKSYLDRGSALAVIGERNDELAILAETPAIGTPNRWLNPAGIADFNGDGRTDIAIVRMPHAAGILELWTWSDGALSRTLTLDDVSNHAIGSRVLRMSAVADFDGDGHPDLAIPSFDRRELRLIAFAPKVREIARVRLPARVTSEIALLRIEAAAPAVLVGLENGAAVTVRKVSRR